MDNTQDLVHVPFFDKFLENSRGVGDEEEEDKRREDEPTIPKNLRTLIAAGLIVGFDHNHKKPAGECRGDISLMLVTRP